MSAVGNGRGGRIVDQAEIGATLGDAAAAEA